LIIGYDMGASEIIYLDAADPGDMPKRMSLSKAGAITFYLFQLAPSR
jgi:hypothetical protein